MKVSQSQVRCYKACRRLYYLQYVEGLVCNKEVESLETGKSYHSKLEQLYKDGYFEYTDPKIDAMAFAYEKYIYPQFKVKDAEQWFDVKLNEKHSLVGRVDGVAEDGLLVEHKTTSNEVGDEYLYNLQWDEQILAYMLANNVNEMYYTICKKPTIRQKQNETEEEYFDRCCQWYAEDTEHKIAVFKVQRNKEEIAKYKEQLIATIDEMESCKLFYNNTNNCTCYGRRCLFEQICLDYDPQLEYVDFSKTKERRN